MTNEQLVIQIKAGIDVADNMLQLWEQNQRFIFKMTNRYKGQAEEDDLVQEGYLGLSRAVDGYDPDQGVGFLPYAAYWIRQRMVRFIHNNGTVRISVHEQEDLYRYRKLCNAFMMEAGREPTDREIGHHLGLGYKAVCRLKEATQMAAIGSLDVPVDEDADTSLSDTIAAPGDVGGDALDKVQSEQLKAVIWPLVDTLPGTTAGSPPDEIPGGEVPGRHSGGPGLLIPECLSDVQGGSEGTQEAGQGQAAQTIPGRLHRYPRIPGECCSF